MFEKFKIFKRQNEELISKELQIKVLLQDLKRAQKGILRLEEKIQNLSNPRIMLETIIVKGIEWYDFAELNKGLMDEYRAQAELLRQNPVFTNEINFLIANYGKKSLMEAITVEENRDMRISATTLAALRERVNEIPKPEKKNKEIKDPHSTF